MTWPFENDTSAITKKLAKKSLKSEKRRNFMIIIAISLAAFLMSMCGTLFFAFQESQNNMIIYCPVWGSRSCSGSRPILSMRCPV